MSNQVQTQQRTSAAGGQGQVASHVVPPVDVFEDETAITLLADLPGVSRERLTVRVDGESMIIEGQAQVAVPPNLELVYGEAPAATYRREFALSRELDSSRIEANLKDGVLYLTIPKAEDARPRRVEVKVN
jgi:HSP20 family molecular chaperone IbpA